MHCKMPEEIERIANELGLSDEERRAICNALLVLKAGDKEGAMEILYSELGKEKAKKILRALVGRRERVTVNAPRVKEETLPVIPSVASVERARVKKGKVIKVPPTLLALSMLEESKRRAMIVTYNPSKRLIKKIRELDKRGIEITVILNIKDCKALAELGFWYACKPRHVLKSAVYGVSAAILSLTPNYGAPYPETLIGGLLIGLKGLSPLILAVLPFIPLKFFYAGLGWIAKSAALGSVYPVVAPLLKRKIKGKAAVTTQKVSIVISDDVGMATSYPLNDRGLKVSRYVRLSYDGSVEREFFSLWSFSVPLKVS